MRYDLYAWQEPRELSAAEAAELVKAWETVGGDPAASRFEPSSGWQSGAAAGPDRAREIAKSHPGDWYGPEAGLRIRFLAKYHAAELFVSRFLSGTTQVSE